jgi:hypothetical protein
MDDTKMKNTLDWINSSFKLQKKIHELDDITIETIQN